MLITPKEFKGITDEIAKQMFPPALSLHSVRIESPKSVKHPLLVQIYEDYFADNPDKTMLVCRAVRGEVDDIPYDEEDAEFPELCETYPRLNLQSAPPLSDFVKSIWKIVLPMWMRVHKVRPHMFEVTAAYRGPAFFDTRNYSYLTIGDFESDDALLDTYEQMNAREGMDLKAMEEFMQKVYVLSCSKIGKPKRSSSGDWTH